MTFTDNTDTRSGFVAVIGAPNAGKSTLVNRMVGAKVSIVTHKVQTTRARVRGVAIEDNTQIVYVDTPGIFRPRRKLDEAMVEAAWEGADAVDLCLLLVDAPAYYSYLKDDQAKRAAQRAGEDTDLIIERLQGQSANLVLVLNKIDQMARDRLLMLTEHLRNKLPFRDIFMISAEKGLGTDDLQKFVVAEMPPGPWMYPADQLSDISDRMMAAEITREKLFLRLHQELPYSLTVETENWTRTKKNELRVEQVIYVERDSQKALVLGRKGQTIKAVGQAAREELESLLGEKVHLFLFAKVRENWANDPARLREMGLGSGGH